MLSQKAFFLVIFLIPVFVFGAFGLVSNFGLQLSQGGAYPANLQADLTMNATNTANVTAGGSATTSQTAGQTATTSASIAQNVANVTTAIASTTFSTSQTADQTVASQSSTTGNPINIIQGASNVSATTTGNNGSTSQSIVQSATSGIGQALGQAATSTQDATSSIIQAGLNVANDSFDSTSVQTINQAASGDGNSVQTATIASSKTGESSNAITYIKNGANIRLQLKTFAASGVSFSWIRTGAAAPYHLCEAGYDEQAAMWQCGYDSSFSANGSYAAYADIRTGSKIITSEKLDINVNNPVRRNVQQIAALAGGTAGASSTIDAINLALREEGAKTVLAIAGRDASNRQTLETVREHVNQIVSATREIGQMQATLGEKQALLAYAQDRMKAISRTLNSIPDMIPSLREEKQKQFEDFKSQEAALFREIADAQQAIEQKTAEIRSAKNELFEFLLTKPGASGADAVEAELKRLVGVVQTQAGEILANQKILQRDTDGDGASDVDELQTYQTDPLNPDTDGDGYLDGDESANGYNPLDAGDPGSKVPPVLQDPQQAAPKKTDVYRVDTVGKIAIGDGKKVIALTGRGLPNSYVTIYIYSIPVVVVIKTDASGQWKYVVDKPLADGEHRVYAATVNTVGEMDARSEEFVFLNSGDKAVRIVSTQGASVASSVQRLQNDFAFYAVFAVLLALGVSLAIIGFVNRKKDGGGNP